MNEARHKACMTGVTGFLGSHFALGFLRGTELELTCLVRGENARPRVVQSLSRAAFAASSPPLGSDELLRLRIIAGDILEPLCGVSADALTDFVAHPPHTFWHFAASLHFEERHNAIIRAHNVGGTRHALELAARIGAKRFVYVSTAYVAGRASGEIAEQLFPIHGPFSNCYEASKCEAEHEVMAFCAAHGLDARIVRPSIVVGVSSTLRTGGTDTGLYGFYREVARMKPILSNLEEPLHVHGDPDLPLNLVPVDHVVEDLLFLQRTDFAGPPIRHSTSVAPPSLQLDMEILCDVVGVPAIQVGRRERQPSPLERILDKRTAFYRGYLDYPKQFVRSLPMRRAPTPDDVAGYLREYAKVAERSGCETFFERRAVRRPGGTTLCAFSAGSVDLPVVILANAYGMPADFWLPLTRAWAARYRILTWETRGLPNLGDPFDPTACGVADHADDLEAVLDAFGVATAAVVGWCSGAQVALQFAGRDRSRARALALLNGTFALPADLPKTPFQENLARIIPECERGPERSKLYCDLLYARRRASERGAAARSDETRVNRLFDAIDPELVHMTSAPFRSGESLYRYACMLARVDREPLLAGATRVRCPVLIVSASDDRIAHPDASRTTSSLLKAQYVERAQGDHFLLYNDAELPELLSSFFQAAMSASAQPPTACGEYP